MYYYGDQIANYLHKLCNKPFQFDSWTWFAVAVAALALGAFLMRGNPLRSV